MSVSNDSLVIVTSVQHKSTFRAVSMLL